MPKAFVPFIAKTAILMDKNKVMIKRQHRF
jgi:hypothetical protein